MKRTYLVVAAVGLVILGTALTWLRTCNHSAAPSESVVGDPGSTRRSAKDNSVPLKSPDASGEPKRGLAQTILKVFNHKAISFYGRVVDQTNRAVPDADVSGSIIYNAGATGGTTKTTTKTDDQGYFSISGAFGRTLEIGLQKEGYAYGGGMGPFQYSELVNEGERHHPDKLNPITFRMWKLQGPEPLDEGMKVLPVPSDGREVVIHLSNKGDPATGADLIVTLKYDATRMGPFDWTATVQAPGGGVIAVSEQITTMFYAPDIDYPAEARVKVTAASPVWHQSTRQNIYLKTAAGMFGKASLIFGADRVDPAGTLTLRWWLNPKVGSHVLEPPQREQPRNH